MRLWRTAGTQTRQLEGTAAPSKEISGMANTGVDGICGRKNRKWFGWECTDEARRGEEERLCLFLVRCGVWGGEASGGGARGTAELRMSRSFAQKKQFDVFLGPP